MTAGPFPDGRVLVLLAIQSPGAPLLKILLTATNTAVISWPALRRVDPAQNTDLSTTNWLTPSENHQ